MLEPEAPLERSEETLLEERVDMRRVCKACCGLGGDRPTSGDMFELEFES